MMKKMKNLKFFKLFLWLCSAVILAALIFCGAAGSAFAPRVFTAAAFFSSFSAARSFCGAPSSAPMERPSGCSCASVKPSPSVSFLFFFLFCIFFPLFT